MRPKLLAALLTAILAARAWAAPVSVLHSFSGADGQQPSGVTLSGSTIYGITQYTTTGKGTVYRMNTDGTGFTTLHDFSGADAGYPLSSVLVDGSKLYGVEQYSSSVYTLNTDGTGYQKVASLLGNGVNSLYTPLSVTQSGSTLYGPGYNGGQYQRGGIFKVNTDGTGYQRVFEFPSLANGSGPVGRLTVSGSTIFGLTASGGANNLGTLFKVGIDGSGFEVLHNFANGANDGTGVQGGLVLEGGKLYGTTFHGGANNTGIVYRIGTDGSDFQVLHSLTDSGSDVGLTLNNGKLYGAGFLSIYQLNLDGSDFQVLHEFDYLSEGLNPHGPLAISGGVLYGSNEVFGPNDVGTVFSLVVPEPSSLVLLLAAAVPLGWWRVSKRRRICG